MRTIKPIALLVSLGAATVLSACDPWAAVRDDLRPADDICADLGDDNCTKPDIDDVRTP